MLYGFIEKYKSRLVVSQKQNIDFFDTFAPITRISSIRILIALTSIHRLFIHQMDVKTAFLNGDLEKKIYMLQPKCCITSRKKNKVCKLRKSLYGLKQTPKQWNEKFNNALLDNGFLSVEVDNVCTQNV